MKTIPLIYINTNPKALNDSENFSIREVQKIICGKDFVQDTHRHDFYYLLVLLKGRGTHTIDFTPYQIKKYSIFIMRPGQVHKIVLKKGSVGYIIQFRKDFFPTDDIKSKTLLRRTCSKTLWQLDSESFKKLFSIIDGILKESVEKKEKYSDVIKASLEIFFIELLRNNEHNQNSAERRSIIDRLEKFSELLDNHILVNKRASQYAKMLNLSPYQLNTITKTALGKTSSELINEQIILESKRYLLSTSNQVKEIAYHLGYEDVSYFIRFFRKHTGLSPQAFRQNLN
ncbi:MAG: AraC family transcriptional regulator [Bacteroidetes bacterium]|nr:AraC family transcriptional regulator [Bacteroidota bacterium]